jgi:DNA gyrase subunit A
MEMIVRSLIEYSGGDVSIEDLIADENVVITISQCWIY